MPARNCAGTRFKDSGLAECLREGGEECDAGSIVGAWKDRKMVQWRGIVTLGVFATLCPTLALGEDTAPDAPLICMKRSSSTYSETSPVRKSISVYVSSPVPGSVGVYANGWADGRNSTGTVGVTILRNNVAIASSELKAGLNRIDVAVNGSVRLVPGEQTKISARLTGSGKDYHLVRMGISNSANCPG
jgi:hypothetical protein